MLITHLGSGIWSYTCRSAGAILFVSVPATIITSDWRGEARKMIPRRSWSYRGVERCIISTAQQARPKVMGQSELCLAQFAIWSRVVLSESCQKPDSATVEYPTHSANCMVPFVPSWLGNGTSAFVFAGGGAPGPGTTRPGFSTRGSAEAGLEDECDIRAACIVRYGMIAVRGLAVRVLARVAMEGDESIVPRSAIDAVERAVDNIINEMMLSN